MIQDQFFDLGVALVIKDFLRQRKHSSLDKESAELTSHFLNCSPLGFPFEDLHLFYPFTLRQ
jgi:hypothetical protein